jgi:prefoldin subunit 5
MAEIEHVALWAGLIASVLGIGLSIVALLFALWTNARADRINNQTINSLQRIESLAEQSSRDVKDLVKTGWDRFVGIGAGQGPSSDAVQIAAGVALEAQSELSGVVPDDRINELERAIGEMRESLTNLLSTEAGASSSPQAASRLRHRIETLSPEALALLRALAERRHLSLMQYRELSRPGSRLSRAVRELRGRRLLVPLRGFSRDGKEIPVYWLPPETAELVPAMLPLAPETPDEIRAVVESELASVGYPDRDV